MPSATRQLSIGEFATATQLSPKALRLYDEQRLLIPARIDSATGYRYYRNDQVHRGRLIRALREVGMTLTDIAVFIAADEPRSLALLADFGRRQDQNYAREKRALRTAMAMTRPATQSDTPHVTESAQHAASVAVRPFTADRASFIERYRAECAATETLLRASGLIPEGTARCALLEPLSAEDARLEVIAPIARPSGLIEGIALRQLPAARCAAIIIDTGRVHASQIAAATDTLFDWFDRYGFRAVGAPLLALASADAGLKTAITWTFETA